MIRTKLAKKVLTKKQQNHLSDMGISSLRKFKEVRKNQLEYKEKNPGYEPCWDCQEISCKLGVS